MDVIVYANFLSKAFKRYSVAMYAVETSAAISTNPWAILDDVMSHYTGTPYNQAQSSLAQIALSNCGWQINALFHERQPLSQIIDDFGKLTGTYCWVADSGQLSARMYTESGLSTVNRTLTTCDMFGGTLLTNPLGTTGYLQQAASKVTVDWAYDYQLGQYVSTNQASRVNNPLCNSAFAAGVQKEFRRQTKYAVDASVASAALYQAVRFSTQAADYLTLQLPARFFGIELCDVLQVQHPLLPNCQGTFQVTKLQVDYLGGTVTATMAALLAGNPS